MQFKNYTQKAVSYEKQMQIDENKTKVETTLERIRAHLPNAIIYNMETDSFYEKIASVIDLSSESDSFIAPKKSPCIHRTESPVCTEF